MTARTDPARAHRRERAKRRRIRHFEIIRSRNYWSVWFWGAALAFRSLAVESGRDALLAGTNIVAAAASGWLVYLTILSMFRSEHETVDEFILEWSATALEHHDLTTCPHCRQEDQ